LKVIIIKIKLPNLDTIQKLVWTPSTITSSHSGIIIQ